MKVNHNEIKEGFLDLVRAELSVYGVDPLQISIDESDYLHIEYHSVDQAVFNEKSNWIEKRMSINCYTVDHGRIIFMPAQEFYKEYRERQDLEDILDIQINEVNPKIKDLHNLFISQLAEENIDKTLQERIQPSLAKNYQITESLSDVLNWKVKIILGNNIGSKSDKKKGDFDDVEYVRIGLKTGVLIPIARGDAHHLGGDLIYHLINKNLIPDDLYYPICPRNDYVDSGNNQALMAFKIWRKLGGPNIVIKNNSSSECIFQITLDDYIKTEGKITINKGELLPLGKELIDRLKIVSKLCIDARHDERKLKRFFLEALKTYTFVLEKIYIFKDESQQSILNDIMRAEAIGGEEGIKKIEQLFFGMNSFKNKLHIEVREAIKSLENNNNRVDWKIEQIMKIFGDLRLANHELGNF